MKVFGGIDFGGTSVKIGLVDARGAVLERGSVDFDTRSGYGEIMARVAEKLGEVLARVAPDGGLVGIGIGTPGFTDKNTGVLVGGCPNTPALQGHSVQGYMADAFRVPAFADNDATCAATGELLFGAGRRYGNFALVTIGTAIGGGLVLDRRVYRGSRGFAAELGHICLDPGGPWCECGSRGCFEQYASGTAIVRAYNEWCGKRGLQSRAAEAKQVVDRARAGEPGAGECVAEAAGRIAQAFGTLLNILNLDACIIGGGVSQAGDVLFEPVRRRLPEFCWPLMGQGVEVIPAGLFNDAGILGAAAQAIERMGG